ncbi:TolC family protein [Sphingopyxis sp. BSN-002]|uniref:TolC family protein n=1 Tax=Sphingopyxis sp. BSN-002 TaxID=2911495 RepID=UPI001EDABF10|nr:TolC family protein [Sphingopyxis sp. BSN-002]UKK83389.1 TolC family protein [Sphingopyxis sp. BSN-002]
MSRLPGALLFAGALAMASGPALAEPVSLSDALARGQDVSPRIAKAKAELKAAEGRAIQAGVRPNPTLSAEVENFSGTGPYRTFGQAETTVAVSQPFELGGKRRARKDVAAAERAFAEIAVRKAEADLAYDISVAHAELRAGEDRDELARDILDRAVELVRIAETLVDVGRDPPLTRFRADALLAEARAEKLRADAGLLVARQRLSLLIGSEDPALSTAVSDMPVPAALPAGVPGLDERLAAAERDAAEARVRLAQAEGVPDITASGGLRTFRESRDTAFVVGISVPLPVFNRNGGNIAAARAGNDAAEAMLARTRLDTRFSRREAELMLAAASERVAALSGAGLFQVSEAARVAGIGYQQGKFTLVELIAAQEALTRANLKLIEAELDRARALAALGRANAQ